MAEEKKPKCLENRHTPYEVKIELSNGENIRIDDVEKNDKFKTHIYRHAKKDYHPVTVSGIGFEWYLVGEAHVGAKSGIFSKRLLYRDDSDKITGETISEIRFIHYKEKISIIDGMIHKSKNELSKGFHKSRELFEKNIPKGMFIISGEVSQIDNPSFYYMTPKFVRMNLGNVSFGEGDMWQWNCMAEVKDKLKYDKIISSNVGNVIYAKVRYDGIRSRIGENINKKILITFKECDIIEKLTVPQDKWNKKSHYFNSNILDGIEYSSINEIVRQYQLNKLRFYNRYNKKDINIYGYIDRVNIRGSGCSTYIKGK